MKHSFKWNKQQILMDFHIRDISSFEKNVKVFDKYHKKETIDFIVEQQHKYFDCREVYFILILVPIEHRYKLKNIVLRDEIHRDQIVELLRYENSYSELWVCTNWMIKEESFSGRFCINCSGEFEHQILEIIKEDAPRLIETVEYNQMKQSDSELAYHIYTRNCWGMRYREFTSGQECKTMDDESILICKTIEGKRQEIELLCTYLEKIGIINLSLDFRYRNGKLEFIDWDTENDKRVISRLLGEGI